MLFRGGIGALAGVILGSALWGLEIPIRRGGQDGSSVGYVDMNRIFQEYPETKKAREEYRIEMARHKSELAEKERDLDDLKRQMEALREAPQVLAAPVSTGTVPSERVELATATQASLAEGLATREGQLAQRREELEKARASSAASLRAFEARQSRQILGRLYKALVQLADERGIRLVVDKSAILYGQDTVDLTDALSRRVRGLPDGEEPKAP